MSLSFLYGRRRFQSVFAVLHRTALLGLGYGNDDLATNGELALIRRLAARWPRNPTLIDVGANRGDWTLAALDVVPGAAVYALEPAAEPFAELAARVGSRAKVFQIGLSNTVGNLTLWSPPGESGLGSVYQRDLRAVHLDATANTNIAVTTLDTFCAEQDIEAVHLLKLDIEGHELAALEGASQLLADGAIEAVQFEFGGADLDARTFLRDFRNYLEPAGFTIHRLLSDGWASAFKGEEKMEVFTYCNFIAVRAPAAN
jgi:FkbM family methyltransferase